MYSKNRLMLIFVTIIIFTLYRTNITNITIYINILLLCD